MARTVSWSNTAVSDLRDVSEYIGRDSGAYARALVSEVLAAARSLRTLSERGRHVPEFDDPSYRELFIKSYRLIYRVSESKVFIIAFVHQARDLGALLGKYEEHPGA